MKKKYGKDSMEFQMFQDYWKFIQEYAEPETDDYWWSNLLEESNKLCRKYGNNQFIRDIATAHISEMERKYRCR